MRSRGLAAGLVALVLVGCSNGEESRSPRSSSTAPPPIVMSAEYTCGPQDGTWIAVEVRARRPALLEAELIVGGSRVAGSDTILVVTGEESSFGFDARLTAEAYAAGTGEVRARSDGRVLAVEQVRLRLAPGVSCG